MWGSNLSPNQGLASGGFVQYPLFANNMKRIKGAGDGGARASWWLLSARGGIATTCCSVSGNGIAYTGGASSANRAPLCFRVA
jgi:hypothetical protein